MQEFVYEAYKFKNSIQVLKSENDDMKNKCEE